MMRFVLCTWQAHKKINGCAFFMCHITWCKCIWCHVEMKRRPTSYRMWATPDIMAPQNTKLKLNTRTWRLASCSAWSECYIVQQKYHRSCTDVEGRHCVRRKHMVQKVENEKKKKNLKPGFWQWCGLTKITNFQKSWKVKHSWIQQLNRKEKKKRDITLISNWNHTELWYLLETSQLNLGSCFGAKTGMNTQWELPKFNTSKGM